MNPDKSWESHDEAAWHRRMAKTWQAHKWSFLGAVWLIALVLGWIGFQKYFLTVGETVSSLDILYRSMQLFILESGSIVGPLSWELETARWLAPAVAAYTAIEVLALFFYEELQMFWLQFARDHIVICGLSQKGFMLAKELQQRGDKVIVIERDENNEFLKQCRDYRIVTIPGDATDPVVLSKARLAKARYLIVVCGLDAVNTLVAINARRLVRNRSDRPGKPLTCFIHLSNLQLGDLLKELQIKKGGDVPFRLEFFNTFATGASVLLNEHPPFDETTTKEETPPRLLVVGLGQMGESLVYQVARRWKPIFADSGKKLSVLVVDRAAEKRKASLCLRYPMIEQVCQVIPLQMDVYSPEFERADFLFNADGHSQVNIVYVCLDDDSAALSAALTLLRRTKRGKIPIVVRLAHSQGLVSLLQSEEWAGCGYENLRVFSLLEKTCQPDLILGGTLETLARAIHENYVSERQRQGESRGDNPALVPWEELPEHLKESNRHQAQHIGAKLRAVGCDIVPLVDWDAEAFAFRPDEIETLARMEHERWVAERLADGWQYADAPKDVEKKVSPWLVPYDELPEEEKEKDREAVRGIPRFLAQIGFQIERMEQEVENEPDGSTRCS